LFAILQKYDFSSKSQRILQLLDGCAGCLRYCKSTIFQANHNYLYDYQTCVGCLRYCKSTIFQANHNTRVRGYILLLVVCDTAKVRFFKQITTTYTRSEMEPALFAILQKYDFSSKSQPDYDTELAEIGCLRYCKSTIFQANHNSPRP